MKKTSLISILSFVCSFSTSLAFAEEITGQFTGRCVLEGPQGSAVHEFHLGPNSKAVVGMDGVKVQVLNNLTHPSISYLDVLAIGVSLDRPVYSDVPRLCPRAPEDRRQECLEENRRKFPPFVPAPQDGFQFVENNGSVEAATSRTEVVEGEPIRVTLQKVAVSSVDELTDGMELQGNFTLKGVKASCSGHYLKN